jgi:hypothetical protein
MKERGASGDVGCTRKRGGKSDHWSLGVFDRLIWQAQCVQGHCRDDILLRTKKGTQWLKLQAIASVNCT